MKDNFSIHEWQLNEKIKGLDGKGCWKGYRYAGTENGKDKCVPVNEASTVYTDWNEYVNPDYILVTLKNGRKLKIEKKHIKGGQRVYQAILQAFNDDKYQITDKLIAAMVKQLGGESIKESENEDHEVSMAQASLKSIISNASQLMNKLGNDERNIPGWIQDHIINAENYIDQANQGFHELDNEYEED
jgi:CRISPR/Cas system CSM-associated protein Csm4 (group 5 of RAMP superfamily)